MTALWSSASGTSSAGGSWLRTWPGSIGQDRKLLAYQRRLGVAPPKTEVRHDGPLEQRLGDQFGWGELVADVARIYRSRSEAARLPEAARGRAAEDRGEA